MNNSRIALITGANKGLGFEVCRQLGQRGFHVFLSARNAAAGARACQQLRHAQLTATFLELDVASLRSVHAAAKTLATQVDHLDVLVNNAGICEDAECSALEIQEDVVRRTLDTNTLGPLWVIRSVLPLLRKSPAARIINVSSGLGALQTMSSGYPAYRISKAALNALTRILAPELAPGIAVNSVSPGWIRTDMGGPNATSSVAEGADSIVWLATEAPHSLTGEFIAERTRAPW